MKLHLLPAHRIGAKPYGSNHNLVSLSNHVPHINGEVWDLLHQNLKPLRTFLEIILVVAFEFMIVKIRPLCTYSESTDSARIAVPQPILAGG